MSNPEPRRWDFTLSPEDINRLAESSTTDFSQFTTGSFTGTLTIPPQEIAFTMTASQIREMVARGELVFDEPERLEKVLREVEEKQP